MAKPVWEYAYAQNATLPIASPSAEIIRLAGILPQGSNVLDVGCGDGRNALSFSQSEASASMASISQMLESSGSSRWHRGEAWWSVPGSRI